MHSQPLSKKPAPSFPALVQMFFTQYLVEQRALSPQTVAAYRGYLPAIYGLRAEAFDEVIDCIAHGRHHARIDLGVS